MNIKLNLEATEDKPIELFVKIKGNYKLVYFRDSYKFEYWSEYDKNGNETYYRNSDKYEWWKGYDENGNETHFRNSDGITRGTPRCRHTTRLNYCPNCGAKLKEL